MGERLRARGAPRSFIFLSNRKKEKENTGAYVKWRPRRSQVPSTGVKVLFEAGAGTLTRLKAPRLHPGFTQKASEIAIKTRKSSSGRKTTA